jgi:membrane protein implicated in regulation of membrane protease activity
VNAPARFSKVWWAWLFSTGLSCGALVVIALYLLGGISNAQYVLAFLISAAAGELMVALIFEAMAPTRVTVGPGDRTHLNSPVKDRARVVSGFSAEGMGKVKVRGEVWDARCSSAHGSTLTAGREVRVSGRDGLTLLVGEDTGDT